MTEFIMPVSEGHTEVTDRAGPAGSEPEQLHIIAVRLSVGPCRPPVDETQTDGGESRCELQ